MDSFTYLVPVDFSESSFNALHYTTMLAKNSGGRINICHVLDLEELPESDNPVVISFALDRLQRTAEKKMKSLREIIFMNGIVVKEEILTGNVRVELMKQIKSVKPGVMVLGRDTGKKLRTNGLLSFLVRKTDLPVLVIPKSHHPATGSRAVLTSEITPQNKIRVSALFEIIKKVTNELSVLNIRSNFFPNAHDALTYIQNLNTNASRDIEPFANESNGGLENILEFIRTNQIDMHCAVDLNAKNSLLGRLFADGVMNQLAAQEQIPVLVIKQ
jgi:nucleotide-binding universal stress UspA family protein